MPANPHSTHHRPGASHSHAPRALPQPSQPEALEHWLDEARALCSQQGAQLTDQRREVLQLMLLRKGSAKAYDLQDDMQKRHGRVAPTTVYRALDFLMEQRLVHKVDSTNTYVVCTDAEHEHPSMMLVCTQCGSVTEWHDDLQFHALSQHIAQVLPGFDPRGLEVKGLCGTCRAAATP